MSILTLCKQKYISKTLHGKPTENPNHFYNASFLFYTFKLKLYRYINIRIDVEYHDLNQN